MSGTSLGRTLWFIPCNLQENKTRSLFPPFQKCTPALLNICSQEWHLTFVLAIAQFWQTHFGTSMYIIWGFVMGRNQWIQVYCATLRWTSHYSFMILCLPWPKYIILSSLLQTTAHEIGEMLLSTSKAFCARKMLNRYYHTHVFW